MKDLEKVSKVSDDCTLTIVELRESYNNWKSVVWVVRIRHEAQGDILVTHGTAFSVAPFSMLKGEVVGMLAMSSGGYEIAIHVAALREILRLFKEQHRDDEDGKRKDISDPKVQGGDSKKFKGLPADRKGKGGHYSVVDTV